MKARWLRIGMNLRSPFRGAGEVVARVPHTLYLRRRQT